MKLSTLTFYLVMACSYLRRAAECLMLDGGPTRHSRTCAGISRYLLRVWRTLLSKARAEAALA
jgi:hypothetical protein